MYFKTFDQANDIVSTYLDTASNTINLSSSGGAAASGVWTMILNSTTAGYIYRPDMYGGTATPISISAGFKHLANYFYGTGTYIIDANNGTTQNTTVKVIQFSRPNLSEGLYKGSITCNISANINTAATLTAIDIVDTNSEGSALGLTGKMVNSAVTTDVWGSVFYDHGVIVFSHSQGLTGNIFGSSTGSGSGWYIGGTSASRISITNLSYKTRSILKRSIYFCRAFNKEFNYTFNPTARQSNGRILDSLSSNPATFISTIGLYNDSDELLAVAKISPIKKKSFNSEVLFRVQLDFAWLIMFAPLAYGIMKTLL
jgi:hypothetical protein